MRLGSALKWGDGTRQGERGPGGRLASCSGEALGDEAKPGGCVGSPGDPTGASAPWRLRSHLAVPHVAQHFTA